MAGSSNPANSKKQPPVLSEGEISIDDDLEENFVSSPSFDSEPEDLLSPQQSQAMNRDTGLSVASEISSTYSSGIVSQQSNIISTISSILPIPADSTLANNSSSNKRSSLPHSNPPMSKTGPSTNLSRSNKRDQVPGTSDRSSHFLATTVETTVQNIVSTTSDSLVLPNAITTQEVERMVQASIYGNSSSILPSLIPIGRAHDVSPNEQVQKQHQLKTSNKDVAPLPLIAKAIGKSHKPLIFQKELFIPQDDEAYKNVAEVYHKRSGFHVTKKPTIEGFNLISDKLKTRLPQHQVYKAFRFHHVDLLYDSLGAKSQPVIEDYLIYNPGSDLGSVEHVKINDVVVELQPSTHSTKKTKMSFPQESAILNNERVILSESNKEQPLPKLGLKMSVSSKLNKVSPPDNQSISSRTKGDIRQAQKKTNLNSKKSGKPLINTDNNTNTGQLSALEDSSTNAQLTDAQDRSGSQVNIEAPVLTKDPKLATTQSQHTPNIKANSTTIPSSLNSGQVGELYGHDQVTLRKNSVFKTSRSHEEDGNNIFTKNQAGEEPLLNSTKETPKVTSRIDSDHEADNLEDINMTQNDNDESSLFVHSAISSSSKPDATISPESVANNDTGSKSRAAMYSTSPTPSRSFQATALQQSSESESDDAFATAPNSPNPYQSPIKFSHNSNNQTRNTNRFLDYTEPKFPPVLGSNILADSTKSVSGIDAPVSSGISGASQKSNSSDKSIQSTQNNSSQEIGFEKTTSKETGPQDNNGDDSSSLAESTEALNSRQASTRDQPSQTQSQQNTSKSGEDSFSGNTSSLETRNSARISTQLKRKAKELEKQPPQPFSNTSKRIEDLQRNSKAISISQLRSQKPTKTIENTIALLERTSKSTTMAEHPYTLKEDLTIIKATSDSRYTNGAIKIAYFKLLAQITFGNKRTGEALRTRYRRTLAKSKDKFIKLCKSQRVEPYLLDEFFSEYDNYVKEMAIQNQTKEYIPATPIKGHTNGGVRKGNFVPKEDVALLKFVLEHSHESVGGRDLYKKFAVTHPWRSFESWRNRYLRHLQPHLKNFPFRDHWSSIPTHILNVLQSDDPSDESDSTPPQRKQRRKMNTRSAGSSISQRSRSASIVGGLSQDSMFQDSRPPSLDVEPYIDIEDSDSESQIEADDSDVEVVKVESD